MPSDAPVHDQGNARTEKTISKKSVAKSLTTDFHLFSDFATDFHSITAENAKTENSRKIKPSRRTSNRFFLQNDSGIPLSMSDRNIRSTLSKTQGDRVDGSVRIQNGIWMKI